MRVGQMGALNLTRSPRRLAAMDGLIRVGLMFFAIALIGLGVEHFIFKDFVTGRAPVSPASIPGGVSGSAFVLAAYPGTARAADGSS